jgi:peptidoglycan/xylan/chitin deacetylase (PgdA/CDA1 family)
VESGALVISLDFELYWGVRDKRSLVQYGRNILGGRRAIPKMLDLFAERDVGATWATVGFVFCGSKDELMDARPLLLPHYAEPRLSPYDFSAIGKDESADPYSFGRSLVQKIKQYDRQEIGTHTLSHFYCLEEGGTRDAFAADLDGAKAIAARNGVTLKSIVFPRNQVCRDGLRIARERGLIAFRGNPRVWFNRPCPDAEQTLSKRAVRLADIFLPVAGSQVAEPEEVEGMIDVPASRFLRPVRGAWHERFQFDRIVGQMTAAAKTNTLFHLWWHPHNFGADPEANLLFLRQILDRYAILRDRFGMRSLNMSEVAERVLQ